MSNPILEQIPVRLQLGVVSNPPNAPVDRNTGEQPRIWAGFPIAFELGVFTTAPIAVDLSNIAYLQIILQDSEDAEVALVVRQIDAADITATIPIAGWIAGTAQQARTVFSADDTGQGLGGSNARDFWLIVQGMTKDGAPIVYGAGAITLYRPGSFIPAPVAVPTSRHRQANAVNDFTVTPRSNVHTEVVDVAGAARTSKAILGIVGLTDGARLTLVLNLPSTPGIIVSVRSGVGTNPEIANVATGSVLVARLAFYWDADLAAWQPDLYSLPPT